MYTLNNYDKYDLAFLRWKFKIICVC